MTVKLKITIPFIFVIYLPLSCLLFNQYIKDALDEDANAVEEAASSGSNGDLESNVASFPTLITVSVLIETCTSKSSIKKLDKQQVHENQLEEYFIE